MPESEDLFAGLLVILMNRRLFTELVLTCVGFSAAYQMEGGLVDLQAMRERAQKKEYVAKQQRWLLFLRHCAKCQAPEGQCTYGDSCTTAKELWRHILTCADPHCQYPR